MKITRPPFPLYPTLTNHRIILREICESDFEHILNISFYDGIPAKDTNDVKTMSERITSDYKSGDSVHWIITSKSTGEIFGTCGFYRGFPNDIGEIGYVLKNEHQGNGYMAEAVSSMLDFGWKELELKAITGVTSQVNQHSINVLLKAGFEVVERLDDEIVFRVLRQTGRISL